MQPVFDTHFHIIDPRFPVMENQGFLPPTFTVDDYRERTRGLGIKGGTVIAGSFQGVQTKYMYDALEKLGPTFVGVIQIPATVTDEEILKLNAAGVRAVRFNLYRGGSAGIEDLDRLARRVHDELMERPGLTLDREHRPVMVRVGRRVDEPGAERGADGVKGPLVATLREVGNGEEHRRRECSTPAAVHVVPVFASTCGRR